MGASLMKCLLRRRAPCPCLSSWWDPLWQPCKQTRSGRHSVSASKSSGQNTGQYVQCMSKARPRCCVNASVSHPALRSRSMQVSPPLLLHDAKAKVQKARKCQPPLCFVHSPVSLWGHAAIHHRHVHASLLPHVAILHHTCDATSAPFPGPRILTELQRAFKIVRGERGKQTGRRYELAGTINGASEPCRK